jgi:hypothetical protein
MKRTLTIVFVVLFYSILTAQTDTLHLQPEHLPQSFICRQIIPIGLITVGSLLNIGTVKYDLQKKIPDTHTHIDDYLQYTPLVQRYLFDLMGIKHQNSVFDQTKYMVISQLFSMSIVTVLKHTTKVQRPVGGKTSFPSGHTATAFVGATILFHEFKETNLLLASSGFAFATATGVLRMTNDANWLPDVLTGAGIGILTANLVYHFKPLKNFQPFKKKKDITLIPLLSPDSVGLMCRF